MTYYTKKPVTIQAHQWFRNGDHPDDFRNNATRSMDLEGRVVRRYRHPEIPGSSPCPVCKAPHHNHGWIDTLEDGHRVCPGDWIITGVKGERYPCKPDIFEATYEPARQMNEGKEP